MAQLHRPAQTLADITPHQQAVLDFELKVFLNSQDATDEYYRRAPPHA
jgi:hypothetical protein